MKHQPYTYLIGWSKHNRFYYGVQYKQGCHPNDFWKKYYTSSEKVAELRTVWGEPDIIQIRKTFTSGKDASIWEQKVLKRMNVLYEDKWLNANIGRIVVHNDETKGKISEAFMGKPKSEQMKKRLSNYAKNRTEEHWENWKKSRKGFTCPDSVKEALSKANKGRRWWNNGERSVLSHQCPPGFKLGRLPLVRVAD